MPVPDEKAEWLVRDTTNLIRGPYSRAEIFQLLKKNQLRTKTEISQANSYWFSVDEKAEINKFFPEQAGGNVVGSDHTATEIQDLESPNSAQKPPEKGEWLSDDYANEFEESFPIPEFSSAPTEIDSLKNRSTAKKDALPSESKDFKGENPKTISGVRSSGTQSKKIIANMVKMQTAPLASANIEVIQPPAPKKPIPIKWVAAGIAILVLAVTTVVVFQANQDAKNAPNSNTSAKHEKVFAGYERGLKKAFLLEDLDSAKTITSMLEKSGKSGYLLALCKAMIKKNFLFDVDGALIDLNNAHGLAKDSAALAEVENLIAVYSIDKDNANAVVHAKAALSISPADSTFLYNLALATFSVGQGAEANRILLSNISINKNELITSDILALQGWIADTQNNFVVAEDVYHRALERDPLNKRNRLLYAIHKLKMRKGATRDADIEFRHYIDLLPDLDVLQVDNFRKMNSNQIYDYAREQIREFNSTASGMGSTLSPVVMAADAMLSANQNRLTEADKILEGAWIVSPGNMDVFKVRAYLRLKEAKYDEVIELLKDLPKEQRANPVFNMVLGIALGKSGKYVDSVRSLQALTSAIPERSEAWSLLADAQLHLKQSADARKNFQMALSKNPLDIKAIQGLSALGDDSAIDGPLFSKLLPF